MSELEEKERKAYKEGCNALRQKLIARGLIVKSFRGTKKVNCAKCGEPFDVLVDRFDSVCGCIFRRKSE